MSIKTAMTKPDGTQQQQECLKLRKFRKFLVDTGQEVQTEPHDRVARMRNSNESYLVEIHELHAEVTNTIWLHLAQLQCPQEFRLALLRAAVADTKQECCNVKDYDFTSSISREYSEAETEAEEQQQHFDLLKLQKFAVNQLQKLLTQLTDNAEAGNLQRYAEPGSLCKSETCVCDSQQKLTPWPRYAVAHVKNRPRKMEDRNLCLAQYNDIYQLKQPYSLFGVFDGHSGPYAANYAATQLPALLADRLQQINTGDAENYREAFETCFLRANDMFAKKCINSGTTAVCVLLTYSHSTENGVDLSTSTPMPTHLYCAWVGDSKALLVSGNVRLQLVKPHKPDSQEERRRIESMKNGGGAVLFVHDQWRINGILNVSRSIGDFSVHAVIAEPDFVDVALTPAHDYLIIATDGLWDYVAERYVADAVDTALADGTHLEDIPKVLIEMAKDGGSQDNITVIIVLLKSERLQATTAHQSLIVASSVDA